MKVRKGGSAAAHQPLAQHDLKRARLCEQRLPRAADAQHDRAAAAPARMQAA